MRPSSVPAMIMPLCTQRSLHIWVSWYFWPCSVAAAIAVNGKAKTNNPKLQQHISADYLISAGLQKQLDMVKAEVVKAQKELRFLKTYKDMEFPVKALQIADMKSKLDRMKEMQKVKN